MKEEKSYNKVFSLSLSFLTVFFLQFILSPVQNLLLMFITYFTLGFFLPTWMKDKRITIKRKVILCLIACLLMGSFVFHNYGFIEYRNFLLWFWVISSLSFIVSFLFNIIKNRE
ncbi:hypothetical protein AX762_10950 [Alkalibacterium sp. 20]|nr:hypothetical protein AX762_10950 [Alkalibacterium sp. 20]